MSHAILQQTTPQRLCPSFSTAKRPKGENQDSMALKITRFLNFDGVKEDFLSKNFR
jgi:hypothetical protein